MLSRKKFLLIFSTFSYINNILNGFLNVFPYLVKVPIYKFLFKKIGKNVYIDHKCYFRYFNKIMIGNDVTINRGANFFGSHYNKDAYIIIGNNVRIAPYVSFFSASHDYNYIYLPNIGESITIKDNVWIGARSIILPGVTVGEGAVIGAGSVVTRDIPDWTIAVGNPAKGIRQRVITESKMN